MATLNPHQIIIEKVSLAVASGGIVDAEVIASEVAKTIPDGRLSRDQIAEMVLAEAARHKGSAVKVGT